MHASSLLHWNCSSRKLLILAVFWIIICDCFFFKFSFSSGVCLAPFLQPRGRAQWDLYHSLYSLLSVSTMQFFTRSLVRTSLSLDELLTTQIILILCAQHPEPQAACVLPWGLVLLAASLCVDCVCAMGPILARGLCPCGRGQSECWQRGVPAHNVASCGRTCCSPQYRGTCASCPERCPWLSTGWEELNGATLKWSQSCYARGTMPVLCLKPLEC